VRAMGSEARKLHHRRPADMVGNVDRNVAHWPSA
jgi:hypothetical protein